MNNAIEISNLKKSFGSITAVDDISFKVTTGELFAFLGINGAGKSTTINMLCGQLSKDSGKIYVDGKDADASPKDIRRKLGVVFQDSALDKPLSVYDNLESRAALYGITGKNFELRLQELSQMLELSELLKRPLGKLSGGQKRRIDVARALLHKPNILILDEPTTGLDPQTRKTLWKVIDDLRKNEHLTVFLTTHYMEEAASADHVVILSSGKIVAEGTPLELKNKYSGDFITLYGISEDEASKLGYPYEAVHDGFRIAVPDTQTATKLILKHPEFFKDYEIIKGNMDDVFLAVTGNKLSSDS